jgi:ribonuclease D
MDIDQNNFFDKYKEIEEDLVKCDFITIDTEFSGERKRNNFFKIF